MKKFILSIDVNKIQKDRLRQYSFTTKDGQHITQTLCDIVGVPLKEKKFIKSGDNWSMYKTGFAVEKGSKEENTNILGDVIEFESTEGMPPLATPQAPKVDEINPEEIPF